MWQCLEGCFLVESVVLEFPFAFSSCSGPLLHSFLLCTEVVCAFVVYWLEEEDRFPLPLEILSYGRRNV